MRRLLWMVLATGALAIAAAGRPTSAQPQEAALPARGGPSPALDLLPAAAPVGVAIENVARLTERGDRLLAEAQVHRKERLVDYYQMLVRWLGVQGLDEQGSAALVMQKRSEIMSLVLAVPVADLPAAAASVGVKLDDLSNGKVHAVRRPDGTAPLAPFVGLRGRHLYFGIQEGAVGAVLRGPRLREVLSPAEAAAFAAQDVLFYADLRPSDGDRPPFADAFRVPPEAAAEERAPLQELQAALDEAQQVLWGVRLDDGVGMRLRMTFAGERSRTLLTRLRGSGPPSDLRGLPPGGLVAGFSAVGSGEASALLTQALLRQSAAKSFAEAAPLFSLAHRRLLLNFGGELWPLLRGGAAGWYENDQPQQAGRFAALAVVETADPAQFLRELTGLTTFVNASALGGGAAGDRAGEVDRLVRDLAADSYRVRQAATVRLALVGGPARERLLAAEQSADAEVRYRARQILAQIAANEKDLQQAVLEGNAFARIKPQFVYQPRAAQCEGRAVDVIRVVLSEADQRYETPLRALLGPDWSRLRLVTIGRRIVFLLGSRDDLLVAAARDLVEHDRAAPEQGGKPPTQGGDSATPPLWRGDELLARFQARAGDELAAQLHVALGRWEAGSKLAGGEKAAPAAGQAAQAIPRTALGLRLEPQAVGLDLYAPYAEAAAALKLWGW